MTSRHFSIYRTYHRVIAVIVCLAMLASYFPKQVWDLLFTEAYAAPMTTLPPSEPLSLLAANPLGIANPVGEMLQGAELPEEFEHLSEMDLLTPDGNRMAC